MKSKDDTPADNDIKTTEIRAPIAELAQKIDGVIAEKNNDYSKKSSQRSSASSENDDDRIVKSSDPIEPLILDTERKRDSAKVEGKDKKGEQSSSHKLSASDDTPIKTCDVLPATPGPETISDEGKPDTSASEEKKSRTSSESSEDEISSNENGEESSAKDALISYLEVDCITEKSDKPIETSKIEKVTVIPLYPSKQMDEASEQDAVAKISDKNAPQSEEKKIIDAHIKPVNSSTPPKVTQEDLNGSSDSESDTEQKEDESLLAKVNAAISEVNDHKIKSLASPDDDVQGKLATGTQVHIDPPVKLDFEQPIVAPIMADAIVNKPSVTKQDMSETQQNPASISEVKTPPPSPTTSEKSNSSLSSSPNSIPSSPRSKKTSPKSKRKEYLHVTKQVYSSELYSN